MDEFKAERFVVVELVPTGLSADLRPNCRSAGGRERLCDRVRSVSADRKKSFHYKSSGGGDEMKEQVSSQSRDPMGAEREQEVNVL